MSNSVSRFLWCVLTLFLGLSGFAAPDHRLDSSDITKPDFFPILPWDPYHGWKAPFVERRQNGLESIADCAFNLAGFVWAKDLKQCEKLGLGAILLPADGDAVSVTYRREWSKLADEEIDRRVRELVRAGGKSRAIKGYFIMDEPGIGVFPALGKAVAAVKKYAPGKLAYINLYPNYATLGAPNMSQLGTSNYTEYLERFVSEVKPQAISYDNYMVQFSDDLKQKGKIASYYRNLLEVRRVALEHQLPYLQIVSANQIRPFTTIPSPANLQFQAYTTLAAGYRGVTWYNYFGPGYKYTAITPANGAKSLTWLYLRDVNAQVAALAPIMSRLTSTGVFFSAPAPVDGLPLLPGQLVSAVACPEPLMVGEFKHTNGDAYVMVVNLSLERSAKFTLTLQQPGAVSLVSAADGSLSTVDQKAGLWLTAGQGALLAIGK